MNNNNNMCQASKRNLCKKSDCVFCENKSFKSHPKSKFWSSNNILSPREVLKGSNAFFLFDCECGHCIEMPLNRINKGGWCKYCTNQALCVDINCITCENKSFKSSLMSKLWSPNNNISPRNIFLKTGKKYLFDCDKCFHEFESIPNSGTGCPFCAGQKICFDNNCTSCESKSFILHPMSKFWSPKNNTSPRKVMLNSNKRYIFDCKCGHSFESGLNTINSGCGCPFCAIPCQKICLDTNCKLCESKSFASHPMSKFWSSKNNISPREVLLNSNKKYMFDCECGHTFESPLNHINTGGWCGYCSNRRLCSEDKCKLCKNKSFASHPMSDYWSSKNDVEPRDIFLHSNQKFIFDCPYCKNEYIATLGNVAYGYWCNCTNTKTETKLYNFLIQKFKNLEKQKKFEWCKKITYLPFDFCIEDLKLIIELDGRQHFMQVSCWTSPEETQERDKYKEDCAKNNGYSIIRIFQEDVYYDKTDWKKDIMNYIKYYEEPTIKYIGKIYN